MRKLFEGLNITHIAKLILRKGGSVLLFKEPRRLFVEHYSRMKLRSSTEKKK